MNPDLRPLAITSPPVLETERLLLRPVSEKFREFIMEYLSDRELRQHMKMPVLDTRAKQQAWWERFAGYRSRGEAVQWCAFLKENGQHVGLLTLKEIDQHHYRGELGYSIMKGLWGQGFGAEAAKRITDYAFAEMGLHTLFAMILPYNTASQRIVKRLGFEQEACFREMHFYEGEFHDLLQFYLINPAHKK